MSFKHRLQNLKTELKAGTEKSISRTVDHKFKVIIMRDIVEGVGLVGCCWVVYKQSENFFSSAALIVCLTSNLCGN